MALKFCSFASGSGGNCIYVNSGETNILIDAGICLRRIKDSFKAIGADPRSIHLLITHTHSDHISHIKRVASEFSPTVYAHYSSFREVCSALGDYNDVRPFGGDFYVGDITVSPFVLSHDVPCVGFSLLCGGQKISILTDTGIVTSETLEHISGSKAILIESNHDENMLMHNERYAYSLKRRILSNRGHLSNNSCAAAVVKCISGGTRSVLLGHISRENNTPELAYETTSKALDRAGVSAKLNIAYQDKISEIIEVCDE